MATPELEHVGQYFWNLVFETSIEDKLSAQNEMGEKSKRPQTNGRNVTKIGAFWAPGGGGGPSSAGAPGKTQTTPKTSKQE